jgi:hypothetical protein
MVTQMLFYHIDPAIVTMIFSKSVKRKATG